VETGHPRHRDVRHHHIERSVGSESVEERRAARCARHRSRPLDDARHEFEQIGVIVGDERNSHHRWAWLYAFGPRDGAFSHDRVIATPARGANALRVVTGGMTRREVATSTVNMHVEHPAKASLVPQST
jgi:hypothetical protein